MAPDSSVGVRTIEQGAAFTSIKALWLTAIAGMSGPSDAFPRLRTQRQRFESNMRRLGLATTGRTAKTSSWVSTSLLVEQLSPSNSPSDWLRQCTSKGRLHPFAAQFLIPARSAENSPFCRGRNIDPTITSFLFIDFTFGALSAYLKEIAKTAIEMVRVES